MSDLVAACSLHLHSPFPPIHYNWYVFNKFSFLIRKNIVEFTVTPMFLLTFNVIILSRVKLFQPPLTWLQNFDFPWIKIKFPDFSLTLEGFFSPSISCPVATVGFPFFQVLETVRPLRIPWNLELWILFWALFVIDLFFRYILKNLSSGYCFSSGWVLFGCLLSDSDK